MPSAARFQCGHRYTGTRSRSATSLVMDAVAGRQARCGASTFPVVQLITVSALFMKDFLLKMTIH